MAGGVGGSVVAGGRWPVAKKDYSDKLGSIGQYCKTPTVISTWCEQDLFAVQGSSEFRSFLTCMNSSLRSCTLSSGWHLDIDEMRVVKLT